MDSKLAFVLPRSSTPGELITFGTYPQLANGSDHTPIKWRVLQNSGNELFMLSEYILDCKQYHREHKDITWGDCDLRKWLNDEFYNIAFTAAEQAFIKTTHCTDNGEGIPETGDKIFLVSVPEVKSLTPAHDANTAIRRRTIGTEFARTKKPDGCRLYVYNLGVEQDYIIEDEEKRGCSWWWLRPQGNRPSRAQIVGARNSIRSYERVDLARVGVRPALKLKLPTAFESTQLVATSSVVREMNEAVRQHHNVL